MTVHCATCGHEWELLIKFPMDLDRFVEEFNRSAEAGCPQCGADGNAVICGPVPSGKRGMRTTIRRDLFIYLSGPMTAAHGYRVEDNVAAGLRVFFACVARGIPAFSPHAIGAFTTTWEIDRPRWLAYDCAVIDHCTHVLMLPRWEMSPGAVAERDYALRIGTPVITSLEELEADAG